MSSGAHGDPNRNQLTAYIIVLLASVPKGNFSVKISSPSGRKCLEIPTSRSLLGLENAYDKVGTEIPLLEVAKMWIERTF